jgi:LacI family transcriptional regulator
MATTSIREVAERAGVSVGTVSNVLNRPEIVAPGTRERVFDAIRELGFVRNEVARQLRVGRSRTVGLVVIDIVNPFFADVAGAAEAPAVERDVMVLVCNSGVDPERERRHLEQLEMHRVMGVLLSPVEAQSRHWRRLMERGTPVVLVDAPAVGRQCSVSVDDRYGGRLAGDHLVGLGHRSIAFAGGPSAIRQVADRRAGVQAAVAEAPEPVRLMDLEVPRLSGFTEGRRAGERLAALPPEERPTAVFCANDMLALGVLQALLGHGLRVPHDMAIVGYDDIEFASAAAVPLTSVRQPRELLGRSAMDLLLEEVETPDRHRHRQVIFQPDLVVRESTVDHRDR